MKPLLLLLLLLVCLAVDTPLGAQTAPVATLPNVTLQTDPATLLTTDFVRSCAVIAAGTLHFKKVGEQTLGDLPYGQYERLKGFGDLVPLGFGLGNLANWKDGERVVLFARYDDSQKRAVAVGKLPATPEHIAKIKQLVAQTPDFAITFSTDKKEYALGEPVKVTWQLKNVSPEAKSIFTGEYATQVNLLYDNRSTSSSDLAARKRPAFTEVKAGQSWIYERTFDGKFPVGELGLEWYYDASDALKRRSAVPPNIVLLWQRGALAVTILPASAGQIQQLSVGLNSPRWNEQLEAAQKLLQSDDPAQWQKLEVFASHPYQKLRDIAAQALAKGGTFSPALKRLFYGGASLEGRSLRQAPGDFALALLARDALEEEVRQRGFKGPPNTAPAVTRFYSPLQYNGDARIGDLLAERLKGANPLEGGVNNGLTLLFLTGLRDRVEDGSKPLSDELKAKVLAAWNVKRATVETPFTKAQLDAEIALARQIRYDDFKGGPFYETVAALVEEGRKRDFNAGQEQDVWDKKLLALPKDAAPDLLRVLKWREIASPPKSVLRFLAQSDEPQVLAQVFDLLTQIAYGQGWPAGDTRIEAIRLMAQLDFARAKTHIENLLILPYKPGDWSREAPRMGAAIALAAHGDKRGVPIIFSPEYERRFIFLDEKTVGAALKTATGQDFPNLTQWQRWWKREGEKMDWK